VAKQIKITGGIVCLIGFVLMLVWPIFGLVFGVGLITFIAARFVE